MRAILTYHSIDASGSVISVSPDAFEAHLAWLARSSVAVRPLGEVVMGADGGDAIALTFDDGFLNFHEVAVPLLQRYGFPATVFVVAEQVGRTNAWGGRTVRDIPELPLMSWRELEAVRTAGIEIGGHTRTHPSLPTLPRDRVEDEVLGGQDSIMQQLGERPQAFAYPYGDVDASAMDVVRQAYAFGCTTELRGLRAADDRAALPRLDMYYWRDPRGLSAWHSPTFRVEVWARQQGRRLRGWARAMESAA